jgi:predicted transcriptional regulator
VIKRDQLMPEEQAEIDAAIAEADRGGGVPAEEVLRELRIRTRRGVDDEYELTEEQEAEIEASIAEIERGEYVDGDKIIRELRRRCGVS